MMDRLGGSVGVSLLATFFQVSELSYAATLVSTDSSLSLSSSQLGEAALHGFTETILLLTAAAFVGFLLAVLLRKDDASRVLSRGKP